MSNNHLFTCEGTISRISSISNKKPAYQVFKRNAKHFFSGVEYPVSSKTPLGQDKYSDNSLSFGDVIRDDKCQALRILKRIFKIESINCDYKYYEAIKGDGHEWKRITTMTSSSLIALLCFYDVTTNNANNKALSISVTKNRVVVITDSKFEVKNKVSGSHYSNMDIVLLGHYEDHVESKVSILLESKFSEYLNNGKCSGISEKVYADIYTKLSDTFTEMGLTTEPDEKLNKSGGKTFSLTSVTGKECHHYATGIKQMISHYLGVGDYISKHPDHDVYLAEILFDFGESSSKKFSDYEGLYSQLAKGINALNKDKNFVMLEHPFTYQTLLYTGSYPLDKKVMEFYDFMELSQKENGME